jgi:hypothetical protein
MSDITIFTPKYLLLILEKFSTQDVELLNKATKKLLTNRKRKASLERNKQEKIQQFLETQSKNLLRKVSLADIFDFAKKKMTDPYHGQGAHLWCKEDIALKAKLKKSDKIEYFVHAQLKHEFYAIVNDKIVHRLDVGYYNHLNWCNWCKIP